MHVHLYSYEVYILAMWFRVQFHSAAPLSLYIPCRDLFVRIFIVSKQNIPGVSKLKIYEESVMLANDKIMMVGTSMLWAANFLSMYKTFIPFTKYTVMINLGVVHLITFLNQPPVINEDKCISLHLFNIFPRKM